MSDLEEFSQGLAEAFVAVLLVPFYAVRLVAEWLVWRIGGRDA